MENLKFWCRNCAGVTQLVEWQYRKLQVAGSTPVSGSKFIKILVKNIKNEQF